jgi:histidine triad (HIT) family protein
MSDCIFCKIINGDIASQKVYEDDDVFAFNDINPSADIHVLVIPKKHIASLADMTEMESILMGGLTYKLQHIAKLVGLNNGFKTIVNTGKAGGQQVYHVHYHILGGKIRSIVC